MKKILALALMMSSALTYADTVTFKEAGFSIDVLDHSPSPAGVMPIQMFISPVNGFSGNVNVQIQPYPGSLEDYVSLSKAQFSQMGIKLISSEIFNDTAVFEYEGPMNGQLLHFYSKVIKSEQTFYLATATDLASEWVKNKNKLVAVIDSLKLH